MKKLELERLETQIKELRTTLRSLDDGGGFEKLIGTIRKPYWTTPAEAALLKVS